MEKQVNSIIQKLNKKKFKEVLELIEDFSTQVIYSDDDADLEEMFGRVIKKLDSLYDNTKRITKEW